MQSCLSLSCLSAPFALSRDKLQCHAEFCYLTSPQKVKTILEAEKYKTPSMYVSEKKMDVLVSLNVTMSRVERRQTKRFSHRGIVLRPNENAKDALKMMLQCPT